MNRDEFLRQFREALEGKVSEQVISENAAYYRNYINSQINSGKDESEVLEALGDPRLLAKTIEESSRFKGGGVEYQYQQDESKYAGQHTRQGYTHSFVGGRTDCFGTGHYFGCGCFSYFYVLFAVDSDRFGSYVCIQAD